MKKSEIQSFDVSAFTACLIGCGGLGCNVAVHLAGSGIGKLYLCDFDTVNESNLNRQFLFTKYDIGRNKAEIAAERLNQYSDDVRIMTITKRVEEGFILPKECDIIICAADNSQTRYFSEELANKNNIPLVLGGVDGFYGIAYLYIPGKSPSPKSSAVFDAGYVSSSVSSTCGIIGGMQASLAVRYLFTKDEKLSGKLFIYDEYKFDTLTLKLTNEVM